MTDDSVNLPKENPDYSKLQDCISKLALIENSDDEEYKGHVAEQEKLIEYCKLLVDELLNYGELQINAKGVRSIDIYKQEALHQKIDTLSEKQSELKSSAHIKRVDQYVKLQKQIDFLKVRLSATGKINDIPTKAIKENYYINEFLPPIVELLNAFGVKRSDQCRFILSIYRSYNFGDYSTGSKIDEKYLLDRIRQNLKNIISKELL